MGYHVALLYVVQTRVGVPTPTSGRCIPSPSLPTHGTQVSERLLSVGLY